MHFISFALAHSPLRCSYPICSLLRYLLFLLTPALIYPWCSFLRCFKPPPSPPLLTPALFSSLLLSLALFQPPCLLLFLPFLLTAALFSSLLLTLAGSTGQACLAIAALFLPLPPSQNAPFTLSCRQQLRACPARPATPAAAAAPPPPPAAGSTGWAALR